MMRQPLHAIGCFRRSVRQQRLADAIAVGLLGILSAHAAEEPPAAPSPVYEISKDTLTLLLALLAALSVAVAALWFSRIRRRRAERLLRASEQRFRDLIETTSDIIWETDANGHFSYVSPRATQILGYETDEFIGRQPDEFLTEDTRGEIINAFGSPDHPEDFADIICAARHKDGPLVHIAVSGTPIRDITGQLLGFRGITHDITRRRESETMRRMTQFVLDHAVDAVIWIDHAGHITYSNETACAWLGYTHDEFQGLPLHEIDPSFTEEIWPAEWDRLRDIPSDTFETNYRDSEGHDVPVEVVASYVAYEGRARICLSIRNISERRNFEDQLRQSQKMESVGMLAGGIAHDFNNMLGGIVGAAELLKVDLGDEPAAQEHLKLILQAADSAAQMTQQLLAFSRKGSVVYKPFDVHVTIQAALAIVRHSIDRRIQINIHQDATQTIIKGDAALLQNAILNLCINARDAMPEGGELTISTRNVILDEVTCGATTFPLKPGHFFQLSLADTGVGMDSHTVEKIFEPFFSTKESGFGTGLGLSAVYGTIQDLRGSIDVVTAPDRGTVFTIHLPLAGIIGASEFSKAAKATPEPLPPAQPNGGCVLIVDDEKAIRDVLSCALKRAGYDILIACDGQEAVELFEHNHEQINVVLLDMLMPRMNGQECFKRMRRIDPNVSVVVQSGFSFEHGMDAMFEQGIRAFLRKPYKLADVVEAVRKALAPRKDPTYSI
jgi:PAS domain S-box-containing protein